MFTNIFSKYKIYIDAFVYEVQEKIWKDEIKAHFFSPIKINDKQHNKKTKHKDCRKCLAMKITTFVHLTPIN